MSELITSPVGTILYMSVDKARTNKYSGRDEYSIRMLFDGTTTEGAAFKNAVAAVNGNKVVTESKTFDIPEGHFIVSAWSTFAPKVVDGEGTTVTEIPGFPSGSTGTAIVTYKTFTGTKGKGLNLSGVAILDLELAEAKEGAVTTGLKEALNKVKKG